jgi:hypothetical protein
MAKQAIGIGASANDGTGDTLRVALDKVNDNFNEVYGTTANSLKIRYVDGAGVAANSQAAITTILGITPVVAGAGYTAFIRYNDPGGIVYNASLVCSDGANWFWFSHDGTVNV